MTNTPPRAGGALVQTKQEISPAMVSAEPPTVRHGRVRRHIEPREQSAGCLVCAESWTGPMTFLAATAHAERPGHPVVAEHRTTFYYWPAR